MNWNSLETLSRSSSFLPVPKFQCCSRTRKPYSFFPNNNSSRRIRRITTHMAMSVAMEDDDQLKSVSYSRDMTQSMGAVLTYRHELGMNFNFIRPDLVVGSCLQTPHDLDKLRRIGVSTVFCLQQDPDLQYFDVDILAIQQYAQTLDDIDHIRAEIRDFDAFDLRIRLPAVVSKLYKAINSNGGITYIHCTAGLGRAPAVAGKRKKENRVNNGSR